MKPSDLTTNTTITIRPTNDDIEVLGQIKTLTGMSSTSDVIRQALREYAASVRGRLSITEYIHDPIAPPSSEVVAGK